MSAQITPKSGPRSPAADGHGSSQGGAHTATDEPARSPIQARAQGRRVLPRWRRVLPLTALLSVSAWATLEWLAQNQAFAWAEPLRIRVVPVVAPEVDFSEGKTVVETFLNLDRGEGPGIGAIRAWFEDDFRGFTGEDGRVLRVDLSEVVHDQRPAPSFQTANPGRLARLVEERRLIRHFKAATTTDSADADVVMYVYFYAPEDRGRYSSRSVACHGTREGFVFVPVDAATLGYYQALFAHELCHTLGARDKYDEKGSTYPQGYAEPVRVPLYPQTRAEIMALAIPRGKGKEAYVDGVKDCVVGDWTAREMGWVRVSQGERTSR